MEVIKKLLFKESVPFTKKKDLNKKGIGKLLGILISITVLGLLFMPTAKLEQTTFHENVDSSGQVVNHGKNADPTAQTIQELKDSQANVRTAPKLAQSISMGGGNASASSGGSGSDRNVSMILSRGAGDTKNSLTPGSRVVIALSQSLTLSNQTVAVTGLVSRDVLAENSLAIPEGSKVIGDATFDDSNGRANLVWKSIILADGRERPFSAVSIGNDNQVGIEGNIHSNAVTNTVGQVLTEFVGAYAQGSMSSGMLGESDGGVQNGLKSAVAQTAKDRANSFGENLKKEHKWIDLPAGTMLTAILSQSFTFRDPGAL